MQNKLIYAILFIYGLLIPKISAFLIIFIGLYKFFTNISKIISLYSIELFLLFMFLMSYYLIGMTYGYYGQDNLIFFTFLGLMAYIFGATINLNSVNILHIFLYFITGLVIYAFVSMYLTYFTGNLEQALLNRTVDNMWTGIEQNSPVVGSYALFPLSLLILIFVSKVNKIDKIIIIILSIFAVITLLSFQSRGPFLSAGIIFIILFIYLKIFQKITIFKLRYLIILVFALIFLSIYMHDSLTTNEIFSAYVDRVENKGLKSARFELWKLGIDALFTQPFGGKEQILQVGAYKSLFIHNTWLDISYATGVIPLFFILLFIFKHIRYMKFLFSRSDQSFENIYFIAIGLAIFLPTMFEPMVDASYIFVSLLGFYLALLKNYYYVKQGIQ